MRTLYLLRHAKSSWDDPTLPDHARPLAPRGRRDAKRIAEHVREHGIAPELVLCSSARRTRETLKLLRPSLAAPNVRTEDGLYGASAHELVERLHAVPKAVASVLLIGHNPGLEDLALLLSSSGPDLERVREKFPTAALATLALRDASWSRLSAGDAELTAYVVPKQLT